MWRWSVGTVEKQCSQKTSGCQWSATSVRASSTWVALRENGHRPSWGTNSSTSLVPTAAPWAMSDATDRTCSGEEGWGNQLFNKHMRR